MEKLNKLYDMVGGTYLYKRESITIKGVIASDADQLIRIKTDKQDITISPLHLSDFLASLLPMSEDSAEASTTLIVQQSSEIDNLHNILKDSIKKIQEDKEYIGQAKAINNHINTMLNMVKLQMQMQNMMDKR